MNVVLARHGESVWHAENRYAGVTDIEMTRHGVTQARRLAEWAGQAGLAAIWSSPQRRARETAELSAHAAGLPLHTDERLRELDFGLAEGLTRAELTSRHPADLSAFDADPVGHHFPGGEDPVRAAERYVAFLRDLQEKANGQRVLVVAHSTMIRLALCHLLGLELFRYRRVFPHLVNCALTEIRLDDGAVSLLTLNQPVGETPGREGARP